MPSDKATNKSRFSMFLCHLRGFLIVHSISKVDVLNLECEIVVWYREGDRVLYVSAFNDVYVDLPVFHAIMTA